MAKEVKLQVYIGGMAKQGGGAEMLLGVLDVSLGVLLIDRAATSPAGEPEQRRKDHVLCSNNPACDDRDALFRESDMRQAVDDYMRFSGRGLLALDGKVERHNPATKIEPDGLDERGRKYRFAPDISDGQVAVIAMCWLAARQQTIVGAQSHFDDLIDTDVVTVGLPGGAREIYSGLEIGPDGWPV